MKKILIVIALIFSAFTSQSQVSKVNKFVDSLSKSQKGIKIFRFNGENIRDIAKLKDEDFFMDVKQLLPDLLLKNIQNLVIFQIGTGQLNESKSLENVIRKADLKTLYAEEKDGTIVQMLTSTFDVDDFQDLLIDIKSYDQSRVTIIYRGRGEQHTVSVND